MNFGEAFLEMNKYKRVYRQGWQHEAKYIEYVQDGELRYPWGEDGHLRIQKNLVPFYLMETRDKKFVPWSPSKDDKLAEDWQVVK